MLAVRAVIAAGADAVMPRNSAEDTMTASDSLENLEDDGLLHANGIDAVTGMPAAPPIAPSEAIGLDASSSLREPKEVSRLSKIWSAILHKKADHGLPEDLENKASDPASVGRAVVFASECSPRFARPSSR